MSGVRQSDSAGLALLLEWVSWAQHYEREIVYENIPAQLMSIAEISEVTDILASHQ
jgi:phospholipid transport system transporter-binding protein